MQILCSKGARVYILDLHPPSEEDGIPSGATFIKCDVTSWTELRQAFDAVEGEGIDIAIANAGIVETSNFLDDVVDSAGVLQEPKYEVVDVNFRAVLNFVKLAVRRMRRVDGRKSEDNEAINKETRGGEGGDQKEEGEKGKWGSIVIVSSSTAFAPEQSLPVYSATKAAVSSGYIFCFPISPVFLQPSMRTNSLSSFCRPPHESWPSPSLPPTTELKNQTQNLPNILTNQSTQLLNLVRSLRSTLPLSHITINAVAPGPTLTKLVPPQLIIPFQASGLPISTAHTVGVAVAYSAIATQEHRVEDYGKDVTGEGVGEGKGSRWNGRTILTWGEGYTEVEEVYARLRPQWMGEENARLTRLQQGVTDFRAQG